MREILDKLRVDFVYHTNAKYTGLIEAIGAGFASRLHEFSSKLNFIEKQAFIETADKDYLYLHAGHLLSSKSSEKAIGSVVFFGEAGSIVPLGTEIKDDKGSFITKSDATISRVQFTSTAVSVENGKVSLAANLELTSCNCIANNVSVTATSSTSAFIFSSNTINVGDLVTIQVDKTAAVAVESKEAGESGNRSFNDKLKTKITISGVNKDAGVLNLTSGKDAENVEDYRKRIKFFLSNPQAPFSSNNIKSLLLEKITSLKYVWVKGGELEEGKVKVYIMNNEYNITQVESDLAKNLIRSIRPAQMKSEFIDVTLPILKTQDVVIKDLLPADDQMRIEVKKNIEYLFNVDLFEKGVKKENIESTIYRTERSLQRVESFTLISGECASEAFTFWKLGNVTFQ